MLDNKFEKREDMLIPADRNLEEHLKDSNHIFIPGSYYEKWNNPKMFVPTLMTLPSDKESDV